MTEHKVKTLLVAGSLLLFWLWVKSVSNPGISSIGQTSVIVDSNNVTHVYNTHTDTFVFIGGNPGSGTTLVRAMLDAHGDVRCGEETKVIPMIIQYRKKLVESKNEWHRVRQGGINHKVLDAAVSSFILETMVQHGEPAPMLCDKDPFFLKSGIYMGRIFPKSKFLFVMRDGRAVVNSVISRKITIMGYDLDDPRACLRRWNSAIEMMDIQCKGLGKDRCMVVHYEQLVLHPTDTMKKVLDFISKPWDPMVLHHDTLINKPGGVSVSNAAPSSHQIIKPIHIESLYKWVGKFPKDLLHDMGSVAPMLAQFGYDPTMNPPNYGEPDSMVANNTMGLKKNKQYWKKRAKQMVKEMGKLIYDYEEDDSQQI